MKSLKKVIDRLITWLLRIFTIWKSYLETALAYFRSSEAIFLLLFANIIGAGAGFGAIFFRWLISFFNTLFFTHGHDVLSFTGSFYVILIPAIGGIIVGLLVYFFAPETKGHGVPEVMLAVTMSGGRIRPRVAVIKALVSSICIGSGGSAGREGPIVQISSALGSSLGQLFRMNKDRVRILVASGAAGGIAATFNAPLAGIFFALEIILREYGIKYFSSVVLSAVTATVVSRHFLGNHPAFQVPPYQLGTPWDLLFYLILGLLTAVAGWVFIKVLYKTEDVFDRWKIPAYVKPAIGGLLIGGIGYFLPQVFGVGYTAIEQVLNGQMAPLIVSLLIVFKILATSLTLGSGGSGGVFAPSLFIGAMLGSSYGSLVHLIFPGMPLNPGAYALVGMGALFAGAAQAPISAILILFEMTGNYKIILPLMIACVISTLVGKQLSKDSIYTLKLKKRGINILDQVREEMSEMIRVADSMYKNIISVKDTDSVRNAGLLIKSTTHRGFPVLDRDGKLVGIITHQDINAALSSGRGDDPVKNVMTKQLILCYPEDSLKTALEKLGQAKIGRLPVVESGDPTRLVGLVTRKSIIEAYNTEILKRKKT